jgi:hypothetical protein
MKPNTKMAEADEQSLYYYKKIIQLCQENDIAVVFLTLPRTTSTYGQYNATQRLSEQYGFDYRDYNLSENLAAIEFDVSKDFYDPTHLNSSGAMKVSHDVGNYLQELFHFTDKRNDPQFALWNTDLQYFKDLALKLEKAEK